VAGSRRPSARARAAVVTLPARSRPGTPLAALLPSGRSIAAGLGLLALGAALYAGARTTPLFAITRIELRGGTPALARELRDELASLEGTSLLALDGQRLLARVEAIPAVRAAAYDRAFPHTLVVVVERERPLAVLRRGPESWLLSARGRVLGRISRGDHAHLPRVWVVRTPTGPRITAGDFAGADEAKRAVRALRPLLAEPLPVRVRTVRVGRGDLTFKLGTGAELRLGSETQLALKLAVARQILPSLRPPTAGGPAYLDVSVVERPVAGTLDSKVEVEG
jgi:cell division septal protein FtsQ